MTQIPIKCKSEQRPERVTTWTSYQLGGGWYYALELWIDKRGHTLYHGAVWHYDDDKGYVYVDLGGCYLYKSEEKALSSWNKLLDRIRNEVPPSENGWGQFHD